MSPVQAATSSSSGDGAQDNYLKIESVELYTYWRSSASWRVRIALALKGISYKSTCINLVKEEQKSEEYVKEINSNATVPSLVVNGTHIINQSSAILEFIEEVSPGSASSNSVSLLPVLDPFQRARVRTVMGLIGCDIHPIQNLRVLNMVASPATPEGAEKRTEWAKHWITNGFQALEALLVKWGSVDFCVGKSVSLADCFLVPQVYNANRFGVDMTAFPKISAITANLEKMEAFKAAHPSKQPDAQ